MGWEPPLDTNGTHHHPPQDGTHHPWGGNTNYPVWGPPPSTTEWDPSPSPMDPPPPPPPTMGWVLLPRGAQAGPSLPVVVGGGQRVGDAGAGHEEEGAQQVPGTAGRHEEEHGPQGQPVPIQHLQTGMGTGQASRSPTIVPPWGHSPVQLHCVLMVAPAVAQWWPQPCPQWQPNCCHLCSQPSSRCLCRG